jgi:hypothetical protein
VDCDPGEGGAGLHVSSTPTAGGTSTCRRRCPAALSLEMELTIFGRDPADPDFRSDLEWDDVCFETTGEQPSRVWQVAKGSWHRGGPHPAGSTTCRMRSMCSSTATPRSAGRRKDSAIVVPHPARGALAGDLRLLYAGRTFWLHSGGRAAIAVDGERATGACLIPLRFGQVIEIDLVPDARGAGRAAPARRGSAARRASASRTPPAAVACRARWPPASPPRRRCRPVLPLRAAKDAAAHALMYRRRFPASLRSEHRTCRLPPPAQHRQAIRCAMRCGRWRSSPAGAATGRVSWRRPELLVTNYHVVA